ncbi:SU10 major capsid protein [Duncaniella muris]|uniref:SU10 major capsid protein n=1 Tax=Duncaniella muris TaxID=2094150 RepID=UPI002675907F|nr:DUF5309 family protein [Duncaniella muris]
MEPNILTTTLSNEISPELLRNEIDSRIVKIRPSSTPLDQISRLGTARHAGSMRVEYYSVDTKEGSTNITEGNRSLSVETGKQFSIRVANSAIFSETETVLLPTLSVTTGSYKGQALVGYITEISADTLTVIPVNADSTPATFDLKVGDPVVRMGRAARELDVQTTQFIALPRKDYNFCQIFKSQVEESLYQRLADKEVGWEFTDQEEVAIMDMRLGMEKSFLFGARSRIELAATGDEVFLTGGIWNQTDNTFTYSPADFDETAIVRLARKAFTGHSGSARKVLIAGSGLIGALNTFKAVRTVSATEKKTIWGIDFHLIVTKFGTLYVHHSEVFDLCGMPDNGMVIDPEYLTKYSHVPFSAERISFRKQGLRNTEGVVLTEASCLVLRHPNAHMRITAR